MSECPTCGAERPDSEFEKKCTEALSPAGLKLYDWGNGILYMPEPSPTGNGWLISNVFVVLKPDQEKPPLTKFLTLRLKPPIIGDHYEDWYRSEILRRLPDAIAAFAANAHQISIGEISFKVI
jgi:hypothetical protein